MLGPQTDIPIEQISYDSTFAGRDIYRLSFAPLVVNGTYNLIMDSSIQGLNNKWIDQDHDGQGGETREDLFQKKFVVDTRGPRVAAMSPLGDISGQLDYIDLWFSEPLDMNTFGRYDVLVSCPDGQIVFPDSLSEIGVGAYRLHLPQLTNLGEYFVMMSMDLTDLAGNYLDQNNDGIPARYDDMFWASIYLADVDIELNNLVVDQVDLLAGEQVMVSWNGANNSGAPLYGTWSDGIYLSTDPVWDIDDILLATVDNDGGLGLGQSYSHSIAVTVPGVLPGDYYIIARADIYNQEKEGNDEGNNVIVSNGLPINVRTLNTDGIAINGEFTQNDRSNYYAIEITDASNLAINISDISEGCNVVLLSSFNNVPSRLDKEYHSTFNSQGGKTLVLKNISEGIYYLHVYGEQIGIDCSYSIFATEPEVILTDISPDHHGPGYCTMTLTGGGFDESVIIKSIDHNGIIRSPEEINILTSGTMIVKWDTGLWPEGLYTIAITKNGITSNLEDSYEVAFGVPYLEAQVIIPDQMGYHWMSTLWIEYANTGNYSMPAPLFKLTGDDHPILTLDESIARVGLWTGTLPEGTSEMIQVMATGSGATPGILQPGDSGRIPVYYLGLKQPWDFDDRSLEFNLEILSCENHNEINWDTIREQSYFLPMDQAFYENYWYLTKAIMGNTWGRLLETVNMRRTLDFQSSSLKEDYEIWSTEILYLADITYAPQLQSTNTNIFELSNCIENQYASDNSDIVFRDYNGIPIDTSKIDPQKRTYFVIHGFNDNGLSQPSLEQAQAIKNNREGNVIIVDWGKLSTPYSSGSLQKAVIQAGMSAGMIGATSEVADYYKAAENTRVAANRVVELMIECGISPSNTEISGHSLGAQVAGFVGRDCKIELNESLDTIIAADPAGPGFQDKDPSERLDESDAECVIVVHSTRTLGDERKNGDIDIYMESGGMGNDISRHSKARTEVTKSYENESNLKNTDGSNFGAKAKDDYDDGERGIKYYAGDDGELDGAYPVPVAIDAYLEDFSDPNTTPIDQNSSNVAHMTDPNKKIGPTGYGVNGFIKNNKIMPYEVMFENMEEATAPVHIIRVTDVVDENLDLNTFELVEIVFANRLIRIPPGLSFYETVDMT